MMWTYYDGGCVNTDYLSTMFIFENKSTNTPCPFEIRGYFDDDSHVVIGKYYSKNQAEYQLDKIIKALNENSAKVFSTTTDDTDKLYSAPPKSDSDVKKPNKLTEEEIAEVILLSRLLGSEE